MAHMKKETRIILVFYVEWQIFLEDVIKNLQLCEYCITFGFSGTSFWDLVAFGREISWVFEKSSA